MSIVSHTKKIGLWKRFKASVFLLVAIVFVLSPAGVFADDPQVSVTMPDSDIELRNPDNVDSNDDEVMVFDLYLSDTFRGSLIVTYTDDWFELEEPDEVINQIDTQPESKEKILSLVTGRIPNQRVVDGVGRIYLDPRTFRVVLALDPAFYKSTSIDLSRKVGLPDSGFSLQQTFSTAAFSDGDVPTQGAFAHRTIASENEFFLKVEGVAVRDRPYQLMEGTLGGVVGDYQVQSGYLEMIPQPFSPSLRYAGATVGTADELYVVDDSARGSRLEVFVPSRSTVQFYRNGQLLAVKILDFGLQEVDTSGFPQGSYDVDIIIIDSSGGETRDRRFYTKAGFLSTRDRPEFTFSAGVVRDETTLLDIPLVQSDFRMRVLDFLDARAGYSATDENSIASVGIQGLYRDLRLSIDGAFSDEGATGRTFSVSLPIFGVALDAQASNTSGTSDQSGLMVTPTPTPSGPGFIPIRPETRRDLIIQSQRGNSFSAYKTVGPVDLRFNVQRNKVDQDQTRHTTGPSADWRILQGADESVTLRTAFLNTENGPVKSAQVFYRLRLTDTWRLDSQFLHLQRDNGDESLISVGLSYDTPNRKFDGGSRVQQIAEVRRKDKESGGTENTLTSITKADLGSQYLRTTGFARAGTGGDGAGSQSLGLNATSSFLLSDTGEATIAHPVRNESILVAEVTGDAVSPTDVFDVLVDGQSRDTVSLGSRAVIGLAPYRQYTVSIRPTEDAGLVSYDTSIYDVVLFPGNVVKKVWRVDKVFIVIGRLVDETGAIIAHERIRGPKDYSFTEEDGSFQAEITGSETLTLKSKRYDCRLDLKIDNKPEYIYEAKDVVCRSS